MRYINIQRWFAALGISVLGVLAGGEAFDLPEAMGQYDPTSPGYTTIPTTYGPISGQVSSARTAVDANNSGEPVRTYVSTDEAGGTSLTPVPTYSRQPSPRNPFLESASRQLMAPEATVPSEPPVLSTQGSAPVSVPESAPSPALTGTPAPVASPNIQVPVPVRSGLPDMPDYTTRLPQVSSVPVSAVSAPSASVPYTPYAPSYTPQQTQAANMTGWQQVGGTTMDRPTLASFSRQEPGPGYPSQAGYIYQGTPRGPRFWFRSEALFWFMSGNGNRVPALVTRGTVTDPVAKDEEIPANVGTLSRSETMFGGDDFGDDLRYGVRFNLGAWVTPYQNIGVEANYFTLGSDKDRFNSYNMYLDNNHYVYARPFNNVGTGLEDRKILSYPYSDATPATSSADNFVYQVDDPNLRFYTPGGNPVGQGGVVALADSFLDGADVAAKFRLYYDADQSCNYNAVNMLAGYQYMRYNSSLTVWDDTNHTKLTIDDFDARNSFNGGLVGLNFETASQGLKLNGGIKLGFGAMTRRMQIYGDTATYTSDSPRWVRSLYGDQKAWADWNYVADVADQSSSVRQVLADNGLTPDDIRGGTLALDTNMGEYKDTKFLIVPTANVGASYDFTQHFSLNVGYELTYLGNLWTAPGAVPTEIDVNHLPGSSTDGVFSPTFNQKSRELWIQGANVGAQLMF